MHLADWLEQNIKWHAVQQIGCIETSKASQGLSGQFPKMCMNESMAQLCWWHRRKSHALIDVGHSEQPQGWRATRKKPAGKSVVHKKTVIHQTIRKRPSAVNSVLNLKRPARAS